MARILLQRLCAAISLLLLLIWSVCKLSCYRTMQFNHLVISSIFICSCQGSDFKKTQFLKILSEAEFLHITRLRIDSDTTEEKIGRRIAVWSAFVLLYYDFYIYISSVSVLLSFSSLHFMIYLISNLLSSSIHWIDPRRTSCEANPKLDRCIEEQNTRRAGIARAGRLWLRVQDEDQRQGVCSEETVYVRWGNSARDFNSPGVEAWECGVVGLCIYR
jgi:hypothetical protein